MLRQIIYQQNDNISVKFDNQLD